MTIKEAAAQVLKLERRPMGAKEIYDKIIELELYSFGARNPVNVVRNTLEYACINTSTVDKNPIFEFVTDIHGNKKFILLQDNLFVHLPIFDCLTMETVKMTIKEAAAYVLNMERRPMGAKEISDKIVELGLYSFGAQNPVNVLRYTMENACINTAKVDRIPIFKAVTDLNGNKKYTLIEANKPAPETMPTVFDENEHPPNLHVASPALAYNKRNFMDLVGIEEGITGLRRIIQSHFRSLNGYSNIEILWFEARNSLSMFLNDNAINSRDDLWDIMLKFFAAEYVMDKPNIWEERPAHTQSYVEHMVKLARQFNGIVSREQIDEYFAKIKQNTIRNDAMLNTKMFMFYANKKFILCDAVELSPPRRNLIRQALDRLFADGRTTYMIIRDIAEEWYTLLPPINCGLAWTPLLLQETLRLWPEIGYVAIKTDMKGQALDTLGVALVPASSSILTFADIAHVLCTEKNLLTKRMPQEDLRKILRNSGMVEGDELRGILHKALNDDYRFAFTDGNKMVKILER